MEIRFVPDSPDTWGVVDLGGLVLALPLAHRALGDAIAAAAPADVDAVLAALGTAGLPADAPFAVLGFDGAGVEAAVRGPVTASAGAATVTGLGAVPWRVAALPVGVPVRLTVPGGEWTFGATPARVPGPVAVPDAEDDALDATTVVPDADASLPRSALAEAGAPDDTEGADGAGAPDDATVVVAEIARRRAADAGERTIVVAEIARRRAAESGSSAEVPATARQDPAPSPAPAPDPVELELPDGSRQPLDAIVVVGRAPSPPADGAPSRLIRLTGDDDISRNHARLAIEGGTVVVTDLGSRNGTVVRIPDRAPQRLRDGEPTPVLVGTVVDLGGGVELRVVAGAG